MSARLKLIEGNMRRKVKVKLKAKVKAEAKGKAKGKGRAGWLAGCVRSFARWRNLFSGFARVARLSRQRCGRNPFALAAS